MSGVNAQVTESVIKQIMEGKDPRAAIDAALDEKAGYHKEKRIRGGKATTVNVKNTKRKVHHTLTADQKKAIKKAHSAAANKKRAKSLKKGAKLGLYQGTKIQGRIQKESAFIMSEDDEKVTSLGIVCPACGEGQLEYFVDAETGDKDETLFVCPDCGETFVIVSTSELEDDEEDDKDEDKEEEKAEEVKDDKEDAKDDEAKAEEEVPQDESVDVPVEESANECDDETCDGENCGDGEPETESGLFFEAE